MKARLNGNAVVAGFWQTLVGSLVAGLAVSAVLGVLVLAISQIG